MKRFISKMLIASILSSSITVTTISRADVPPPAASQSVPDDPGKITPLKKGQPAPYPGVLFSPKAAAVVATELSTAKDKTKIEVKSAVDSAEAKKDFKISEINAACKTDKSVLTSQVDEKNKEISRLMKDLKEKESSTPSRTFWASLGFVSGTALTMIVVFVVGGLGSSAK